MARERLWNMPKEAMPGFCRSLGLGPNKKHANKQVATGVFS